jgi:phosphoglucosamine mutase
MAALAQAQKRVEGALGAEGRVLVRWSGTEPKLRIMLEGPDERRLRDWSKELAEAAARDVAVAS